MPGSLAASTGYARFTEVAARHAGPEAVNLLSAYFVLGNLDDLVALFAAAGLEVTATRTRLGAARFASIDEFVTTEVEASPLIERLDDTTYRRIRDDAQDALQPFVTTTGIEVSLEWHLVAAKKQ